VTSDEWVITRGAQRREGNSLVLLQTNYTSVLNKSWIWHIWSNVIIGTESWHKEQIGNAELFRNDYITFKRDRNTLGCGEFICVKITFLARNYVWTRISRIAVEVKRKDTEFTWENLGIYRAPNEDMQAEPII
jgi:hypothetical protein